MDTPCYYQENQAWEKIELVCFCRQDERGSEVYLGTSLMGIDVRPAAGHTHVFYR